eukprot:SAG11_NODE_259_length_11534_cov_3.402361_8_plen_88_part_00
MNDSHAGGVSVLCDVGISARCRGGTAAFGILCALCNGNPEIQVGLYYSTHLNQGIGNIVFPWVVRLADEFAGAQRCARYLTSSTEKL